MYVTSQQVVKRNQNFSKPYLLLHTNKQSLRKFEPQNNWFALGLLTEFVQWLFFPISFCLQIQTNVFFIKIKQS